MPDFLQMLQELLRKNASSTEPNGGGGGRGMPGRGGGMIRPGGDRMSPDSPPGDPMGDIDRSAYKATGGPGNKGAREQWKREWEARRQQLWQQLNGMSDELARASERCYLGDMQACARREYLQAQAQGLQQQLDQLQQEWDHQTGQWSEYDANAGDTTTSDQQNEQRNVNNMAARYRQEQEYGGLGLRPNSGVPGAPGMPGLRGGKSVPSGTEEWESLSRNPLAALLAGLGGKSGAGPLRSSSTPGDYNKDDRSPMERMMERMERRSPFQQGGGGGGGRPPNLGGESSYTKPTNMYGDGGKGGGTAGASQPAGAPGGSSMTLEDLMKMLGGGGGGATSGMGMPQGSGFDALQDFIASLGSGGLPGGSDFMSLLGGGAP